MTKESLAAEIKILVTQLEPLIHIDVHYQKYSMAILRLIKLWCQNFSQQELDAIEYLHERTQLRTKRNKTNAVWKAVNLLCMVLLDVSRYGVEDEITEGRIKLFMEKVSSHIAEARTSA